MPAEPTGEEPTMPAEPTRGHRTLPHTADVIVEVWAPDTGACCEEAIAQLLALCVEGAGAEVIAHHRFTVEAPTPDAVLLGALDEVVFLLDTLPDVPIGASAHLLTDGALAVELHLAARPSVTVTGSTPKAISRSGFEMERTSSGVRASFLVDV